MSQRSQALVALRVNVSMVSLKWSDVLSTLLPGALAVFAMAPYFPSLRERIERLDELGWEGGILLLMVSALAGGVVGAFNKVAWEKQVLVRLCPNAKALEYLTPENLPLYERGVDSSYKYSTFYANFGWATGLLLARRLEQGTPLVTISTGVLAIMVAILLYASYVQWTYYVNYNRTVFCKGKIVHAGKRRPNPREDTPS